MGLQDLADKAGEFLPVEALQYAPFFFGTNYDEDDDVEGEPRIIGTLYVDFKNMALEESRWKPRLFRRQVVPYSVSDYLGRAERVLQDVKVADVLTIDVDSLPVYADPEKKQRGDLRQAISEAQRYVLNRTTNTVSISSLRELENMELLIQLDFARTPWKSEYPLDITLTGIPSVFMKQPGETQTGYEARHERLLEEAMEEEFQAPYQQRMKQLVAEFEASLRQRFDVETVEIGTDDNEDD